MVEIEEIFSSERGKGSRSAAVGRFERATLEVDTNRRSGRATYMMTFRGSLGLVAIFGLFSMAAASPWFYHGLEGPSFTEKNTTSSGLEIRSYPESYWTATTVTGKNMDSAGSEAFMRLFRYISGDNERNEKIEMTVPVLASVVPGQGPFCEENFTYHFYLPKKFQSNPPKPSDPRVTNVALPALDVAVISYPGWSNEKAVIENGRELFQELKAAKVPYDAEMFYTAGYDSPFRLTDRHNEVWVKLESTA